MMKSLRQKNRFLSKITLVLCVLPILFGCTITDRISLGNGYWLAWPTRDKTRILKDDQEIVAATIVSYDKTRKYVAGLRLEIDLVTCGYGDDVMVTNTRMYFILDKETDSVLNFDSQTDFDDRLNELGIRNRMKLSYSQFDEVWEYYSTHYNRPEDDYFRNCVPKVESE